MRNLLRRILPIAFAAGVLTLATGPLHAQGVTNAAISGSVSDVQGAALPNAEIVAVHQPSGTRYQAVARSWLHGAGRDQHLSESWPESPAGL
jgi:hypothetical protein